MDRKRTGKLFIVPSRKGIVSELTKTGIPAYAGRSFTPTYNVIWAKLFPSPVM